CPRPMPRSAMATSAGSTTRRSPIWSPTWKAQMPMESPIPAIDAMRRRPVHRRGFTLTESLIASAVLAASVIGVAAALSASYQHAATLESTATATTLARQLLEQVVAMPFDDADS